MASISDVNSVCDRIHSIVQMSGLHFIINQTPWSSYITIRRKFVSPGAYNAKIKSNETAMIDQLKERNKHLENKVAELEFQLVELEKKSKNEKDHYKKNVEHLHTKIATLEKETKTKDITIQNINTKVSNLDTKVGELETSLKIEKKAVKKRRQTILNQADESNVDDESGDKDLNENLLFESDLSAKTEPSLPELNHSPPKQCSPERGVPATPPPRRCSPGRRPRATAPSPHTPPGLPPPPPERLSGPSRSLSGYFVNADTDLAQASTETDKPFITTDYIKNISKLSLVPKKMKNSSS